MGSVRDRLPPPPSSVTGPLGDWLTSVYKMLNTFPAASYFSGTTPNSVVTGVAGDLAINIGSASTSSRAWVKAGDPEIPDQSNWVILRIATP